MTTSTSSALREYFQTHSFTTITNATSLVAIFLLLAVLVEREVLRMNKPESARRNVVTFASVVLPIVIVFAAVVAVRFARLS